jgi:hypothetical protein
LSDSPLFDGTFLLAQAVTGPRSIFTNAWRDISLFVQEGVYYPRYLLGVVQMPVVQAMKGAEAA